MGRVDCHRRENWQGPFAEESIQRRLLLVVQLRRPEQSDAFFRQRRADRFVPAAILRGDQFLRALRDPLQLGDRAQTVGGIILRGAVAERLLPQPGHANHEKLVEVRAENRQELHPLQQRSLLILRLLQHAGVELQPAQLAVDEQIGRERLLVHKTLDWRQHNHGANPSVSYGRWQPAAKPLFRLRKRWCNRVLQKS